MPKRRAERDPPAVRGSAKRRVVAAASQPPTRDTPGRATRARKREQAVDPVSVLPHEISEMIFHHIPMRQLFLEVPLVCKRWRDKIMKSPTLRQKMFLKEAGTPVKPVLGQSDNLEPFPLYADSLTLNPAPGLWRYASHKSEEDGRTHPKVGKDSKKKFAAWSIAELGDHEYTVFLDIGSFACTDHIIKGRSCSTEQSWANMLLTQPPVVAAQLTHDPLDGRPDTQYYIYNKDGLTCGDLHCGMQDFEARFPKVFGTEAAENATNLGFRIKRSSLDDETCLLLDSCKGRKHWDGLCGCLWQMQREVEYQGGVPTRKPWTPQT